MAALTAAAGVATALLVRDSAGTDGGERAHRVTIPTVVTETVVETVPVTVTGPASAEEQPVTCDVLLADVLDGLEEPNAEQVDLPDGEGVIADEDLESAPVLRVYSPVADPEEARLEVPVAEYSSFEALTALDVNSPSSSAATLRLYRDRVEGTPLARVVYHGPSVKRRISVDLADTTTLIFRFTPAPGESRIPNGIEIVLGDAAFCSGG